MKSFIAKPVSIAICLILFSSCSDSPFLSKEEAEKLKLEMTISRDPFRVVTNVAAIINNDIYYFSSLYEAPKRLTHSPQDIKKDVKLSHDKSQIAYLNKDGHPVIIKTSDGGVIKILNEFNYIKQMDWARDRLALYMLSGRTVYSYGDPLNAIQPESSHPWDDLYSYSMNGIGDYAYFIHRFNTAGIKLIYHSDGKKLDREFNNIDGDLYNYVDFYDNKGNFLLGYHDHYEDEISRIICVQDYNFWPAYEWDYELMRTPSFNSEHEILLYGTATAPYTIKAVYLGTKHYDNHGLYDRLTKVWEDYTSKSPISLDWAHN